MYKCLECGFEFEEPTTWRESRGEFWGAPCYESMRGCPRCKGEYDEVREGDDDDDWHRLFCYIP